MKRRFDLDLIRALACIMIIFFHFQVQLISNQIQTPFSVLLTGSNCETFGFLGVGLFLILSGYVLVPSFEKDTSLKSFYKKRLLSILPMFYIAYFIAYTWFCLPIGRFYDKHMIYSLFAMDGLLSMNGVTTCYLTVGEWYLGIILLYYLIFPILYKAIKQHPYITGLVLSVLFVTFTYIIPFEKVADASFFTRLIEFSFGIYLALYLKNLPGIFSLLCGIVFLCLSILAPQREILPLEILANICLFLFLMALGQFLEKTLSKKSFGKLLLLCIQSLSLFSYAYFLTHHIVITKMMESMVNCTITISRYFFLLLLCFIITVCLGFLVKAASDRITGKIHKKF